MGDFSSPVQAPAHPPGITLEFFDWECGHHWSKPEPITGLASVGQAEAILRAIASAISQPGNGRGWIISGNSAQEVYVTDDHVSLSHRKGGLPIVLQFPAGTDLTFDEEAHNALRDHLWEPDAAVDDWIHPNWDGNSRLQPGELALTTLADEALRERLRPEGEPPLRIYPNGVEVLLSAIDWFLIEGDLEADLEMRGDA